MQGETQKTEYVILDQSESLINEEEKITKGEEKNIQIIKVTNERPLGFENMLTSEFIIVSDECIKDFTPYGSIGIYIKSSNPDKLQEDIEKALTGYIGGYSLNNIARSEKNQRSVFTLVAIFLFGFIAVIALYYAVGRWNYFFTSAIFISNSDYYPLQLVLRDILINSRMALASINAKTMTAEQILYLTRQAYMAEAMKYAIIFIASLPLLIAYPFVQKHFVKGVMVGSVKG